MSILDNTQNDEEALVVQGILNLLHAYSTEDMPRVSSWNDTYELMRAFIIDENHHPLDVVSYRINEDMVGDEYIVPRLSDKFLSFVKNNSDL